METIRIRSFAFPILSIRQSFKSSSQFDWVRLAKGKMIQKPKPPSIQDLKTSWLWDGTSRLKQEPG